MNRSFRAEESKMQGAFKQMQKQSVKEKEEDLALFLEMKKREKEHNDLHFHSSEELDVAFGSNSGTSPIFNISSSAPASHSLKTGADDFLNSENDKNDYDWLLTPPGTPLFPSLEMETHKTVMSQLGTPTARPMTLKSRLANSQPGRTNLVSKQPASSPQSSSSGGATRRPSSSGGPGSRPGTPTGRLTSSSASKSSRPSTPTRATLPSTRTMVVATSKTTTIAAKPMVSANKTSSSAIKTTVSAAKPTIPSRSSTPLSRSTARSSTPTSRPTLPPSRSASRASTPTRRSSTPSSEPDISAPSVNISSSRQSYPVTSRQSYPVTSRQSYPVTMSRQPAPVTTSRQSAPVTMSRQPAPVTTSRQPAPVVSRQPAPVASRQPAPVASRQPAPVASRQPAPVASRQPVTSRGTSPTVRSRPWKPSEMPGFSLDAPPNLRTTLPERPLSATRGRPGAPTSRSSSVEPSSSGRPKRQSCSPSRGRSSNGTAHISGNSMPAVSRGYSRANDNVSPVVMGTKMVERVINMRKLAPPRMDDKNSPRGNLSGKSSSSPDSSGFGRTLSKKSLDMAIRHMDIRRTIPGNLRPLMTNIPASSLYSVRSGPQRSRTLSVSGSPHATSSNASSELSVNQSGLCLDTSEVDDDIGSERCSQSPASVGDR
ncbi:hypothetical protein Lal_00022376 [Lupinus albus]|uniref:Uncharacterized protein n=1 Tax=Lupinus albus TaxID=3870 RepID=A0A6A5PD27_LUPAL|nr:hypothetical protein Lalb_Chr15g0084191 [Lupinus albus]KAF1894882.1 hypothetical protein Lal_00022376 [Lupinus albus]